MLVLSSDIHVARHAAAEQDGGYAYDRAMTESEDARRC
jgi:hypothetical protein